MAEAQGTMKIVPVIMSGGSGTRLWPLSTDTRPKQFHALAGARTMLQETALRFSGDASPHFAAPVVICNRSHERVVEAQLADIGVQPQAIVLEPFGRNTAAVAVTAARMVQRLQARAPWPCCCRADHVITDPECLSGGHSPRGPIA